MAGNPTFSQFNPRDIPWQYKVKEFMRETYEYEKHGLLEILLSGSVGSAKSIFAANMIVSHCLMYSDAVAGLFRLTMPDLKETIYATILEHLEGSEIEFEENGKTFTDTMREGVHYTTNTTQAAINFINGAKVRSKSWADKKWGKLRSHNYSVGVLEEYTENDNDIIEKAYDEISTRVGRISSANSNVRENWLLNLTNPEGESHYGHEYFISKAKPQSLYVDYKHRFEAPEGHHLHGVERHFKQAVAYAKKDDSKFVFYSLTEDNPYLDPNYVKRLKRNLSPIQYRRKLKGEWVDDQSDKIYSYYNQQRHFKPEESYKVVPGRDLWVSWDFNIGEGKPLSAMASQYDKAGDHFHDFFESVIEGADTYESLEDMASRGLFEHDCKYLITGDATGKAKATQSKKSDWDIIKKFLANYRREKDGRPLNYEVKVKASNPPVRKRHNDVNAYLENAEGQFRTTIYKDCPVLEKGMRLTTLKKGGNYIEDDSKSYQHVTTAKGYLICSAIRYYNSANRSFMIKG